MTVNQIIDNLTRMVVHKQVDGDAEVKFSTPHSEWQINSLFCSLENNKVYLAWRENRDNKAV